MPRIDFIWAALSVDATGNEGVIGAVVDGRWMPLVAADPERLDWIAEKAALVATTQKCVVRIVKFGERSVVHEFDGGAPPK